MNDIEAREISLSIPAMIWQRWEGLVKVALERSDGVLDFKLKLARAWVKFDPVKISEEKIITNIKKLTRYDHVEISEKQMDEMNYDVDEEL